MIFVLMLLAGGQQSLAVPHFTDADVARIEACADTPARLGACDGAEAEGRAAIACMTTTGGDEAFERCQSAVTDACAGRYAGTTPEMNRRVILICSARTRAGLQVAVEDWFRRAERRLPAPVVDGYRGTRATVDARADAYAEAAPDSILASAGRTGVWQSFARFLWNAEKEAP